MIEGRGTRFMCTERSRLNIELGAYGSGVLGEWYDA
jgi:hypothetical protein